MKLNFSWLLLPIMSLGCATTSHSVPLPTHDYCADVPILDRQPLSKHLIPYAEQLKGKSGVYVLEQGTEAMMSRAWLTERAEKTIDIQYFIFSVDNIGLIATDYLVRAAERGVQVRVLVDDIMLEASGDELVTLTSHENIHIKVYNPNANVGKNIAQKLVTLVTDFHGLNQRMHNKIFLVDNKVAITGGRNIADEYFGFDHTYNFRDRDVLLAGEVIDSMSRSFEEYWNHEIAVSVEELIESGKDQKEPNFTPLHQYACDPENFHPEIRNEIEQVPHTFDKLIKEGKLHFVDDVEYLADQPGKNDQTTFLGGGSVTKDRLVELANQAKKSIIIQTPYLVTTKEDRKFLTALVNKGIDIRILTNSLASNDNLEAFSGYQRDRKALLATGVDIYEFRPNAKIRQRVMNEQMYKRLPSTPIFGLHSKTMTIDNDITVIGTYNLDPRSANLNTESITIIPSKGITKDVREGMLAEMEPENAWRVTKDFNPDDQVTLTKQLRVKVRRVVPKNIL
ncbi:phospholipase D-like domain-containing protein [Vibrio sonorensis]|uniref:phospholipase D-like domain-containing protein n=1 Tax=Vibrio sonorensis TaxID=1004316 RepID=UPI0008D9A927|nr:phospholipase D family protein [Vibrio sonorensis]